MDPDAEAMDTFARAVRLGYLQRRPRTPAVKNAKSKWRLKFEEMASPPADWSPHYKSARERSEFLQKKVSEDLESGRMRRMTHGKAKELLLQLAGVPRDQDSEADAFTNGVVDWLPPRNRVGLDMALLPFKVLNELLERGREFYRDHDLVNPEA